MIKNILKTKDSTKLFHLSESMMVGHMSNDIEEFSANINSVDYDAINEQKEINNNILNKENYLNNRIDRYTDNINKIDVKNDKTDKTDQKTRINNSLLDIANRILNEDKSFKQYNQEEISELVKKADNILNNYQLSSLALEEIIRSEIRPIINLWLKNNLDEFIKKEIIAMLDNSTKKGNA